MADGTDSPVRSSAFGCITIPFLLIAAIPLAWGARSSWVDGQLARSGDVVTGEVLGVEYIPTNPSVRSKRSSGGSPTVRFTTRAGETRTAIGSTNRAPAPWKAGDRVEVVYDPANPARADLKSEVDGWRWWFAIWCAVALLPLAIAFAPVVLLIRQRRRRRAS